MCVCVCVCVHINMYACYPLTVDCNRENILGFYLAMDWNNDSSKTPYMEVVSKEMVCS